MTTSTPVFSTWSRSANSFAFASAAATVRMTSSLVME
jgi:hypothetical protein